MSKGDEQRRYAGVQADPAITCGMRAVMRVCVPSTPVAVVRAGSYASISIPSLVDSHVEREGFDLSPYLLTQLSDSLVERKGVDLILMASELADRFSLLDVPEPDQLRRVEHFSW